MASPYLAHAVLLITSDVFLWKIGKLVVGKSATKIAMILILTNLFMVEHSIRCFTNTLEMICSIIAFYFFLP
jgi:hypothetical protein